MTSQKGFAHAFLIIGLVVALIGALGFVFWQNFIYQEPVAKTEVIEKSAQETTVKSYNLAESGTPKEFDFAGIMFKYPASWESYRDTGTETTGHSYDNSGIRSSDYKLSEDDNYTIEQGAEISVNRTNLSDVSEPANPANREDDGYNLASFDQVTTMTNEKGYLYSSSTSTENYSVEFRTNAYLYELRMNTGNIKSSDEQKSLMKAIAKTVSFKND